MVNEYKQGKKKKKKRSYNFMSRHSRMNLIPETEWRINPAWCWIDEWIGNSSRERRLMYLLDEYIIIPFPLILCTFEAFQWKSDWKRDEVEEEEGHDSEGQLDALLQSIFLII